MTPADFANLAARWRTEADAYERDGVTGHAAVLRRVAAELEEAWRAWQLEELPISQAAAESGYSEDRLRGLVRESRLPVARGGRGKRGELRVRRCDLPRRPGAPALDPVEDLATKILGGRR